MRATSDLGTPRRVRVVFVELDMPIRSGYVYPKIVWSRMEFEVQKLPLSSLWKGLRAIRDKQGTTHGRTERPTCIYIDLVICGRIKGRTRIGEGLYPLIRMLTRLCKHLSRCSCESDLKDDGFWDDKELA